jgi:NAD(P)-dependent dehydrogenase (short-subunit alcohol dehydrogenase family)
METLDRLFGLGGKVALVTGASGGIGEAVAAGLLGAGAHVALHGTSSEKLTALKEKLGDERVSIHTADLSGGRAACDALIEGVVRTCGGLDILINNAGINRRMPVEEFTDDDYAAILSVNQEAVFKLCQAAHPHLKNRGGGKILNVGSMTSVVGIGNVAIYGMTKAAIAQLSKTLAVEWARDNIQVNCLAPGFIKTPLTAQGQWAIPERAAWLLSRIPARRPGSPEDLVGATLLLCSPAGDYLTGQVLAVDGGFLAGASWSNP